MAKNIKLSFKCKEFLPMWNADNYSEFITEMIENLEKDYFDRSGIVTGVSVEFDTDVIRNETMHVELKYNIKPKE